MKKMRRLIPAIAMLLVSAVMLSTASFAWFTMNEKVTASGMEIKAKADGSLLISEAPMTADGETAGQPDITINDGVQNLYPMAYAPGQKTTEEGQLVTDADGKPVYNEVYGSTMTQTAAGWYVPTDNKTNDIQTGLNSGEFTKLQSTEFGDKAYVKEFYIATVDEAKTNATLQIDLSALAAEVSSKTWNAYAAALYVVEKTVTEKDDEGKDVTKDNPIWANGADVAYDTAPNAIIFAEPTTKGIVELTGLNIPSVAGAVNGNVVGLKIVVHFYVDGALMAEENGNPALTKVLHGSIYAPANAKYEAEKAYTVVTATKYEGEIKVDETDVSKLYTRTGSDENGYTYTPAYGTAKANTEYFALAFADAIPTDEIIAAEKVPANWYNYSNNIIQVPYAYVRSADIPATSTVLELSFKLLTP